MEEYRACLGDRFVLGLINRRLISPDDFIFRTNSPKAYVNEEEMASRRPVEMKPRVCRTLITAYEEMMNRTFQDPPTGKQLSYRRLILNQARQWAEMVQTEDEVYQPFVWET
ncbi:MAG: CRISPR-associated endonuclease Cas1 [Desulfobacterales bacterium]